MPVAYIFFGNVFLLCDVNDCSSVMCPFCVFEDCPINAIKKEIFPCIVP